MSDEEVKAIIPQIRVIARALPTDKSRMVRSRPVRQFWHSAVPNPMAVFHRFHPNNSLPWPRAVRLVGIRDDVRPEAKEAIEEVQNAGIQVVMITGDRLETAVAIAKDAGLLTDTTQRALTSAELNKMSDEEVKAIIALAKSRSGAPL